MMPTTRRSPGTVHHHLADHRASRPPTAYEVSSPRSGFVARVHFEGPRAVLSPRGELDIAVVPDLVDLARKALTRSETQLVIIDLSGVTFVDATGCSGLEQISRACEVHRKHLRLQGARPQVLQVLVLVGLERLAG